METRAHGAAAGGRAARDARAGGAGDEPVPAAWSAEELLLHKDFADYSAAERAAARALLARLARRGAAPAVAAHAPDARRGGRPRPAGDRARLAAPRRRAGRPPLPRAGDCASGRWCWSSTSPARWRPTRGCCSSTSQAAVAARRRVEAFAFGTRLTRITRELHGRDPDRALARATAHVVDLGGGTRIGDALATLNREHGRRIGRGAAIVVLVRRLGPRRPGAAGRRDGAAAPHRAPARVAEPARRRPGLRAADARHAGRAPAHRPPAGGQLDRLARGAGRPAGGRSSDRGDRPRRRRGAALRRRQAAGARCAAGRCCSTSSTLRRPCRSIR